MWRGRRNLPLAYLQGPRVPNDIEWRSGNHHTSPHPVPPHHNAFRWFRNISWTVETDVKHLRGRVLASKESGSIAGGQCFIDLHTGAAWGGSLPRPKAASGKQFTNCWLSMKNQCALFAPWGFPFGEASRVR